MITVRRNFVTKQHFAVNLFRVICILIMNSAISNGNENTSTLCMLHSHWQHIKL